jgi:urease accessory protein
MEPESLLLSNGSALTSQLRTDRVGRDGTLRLSFERRAGRTVLTERGFTLPLQALEPAVLRDDGVAYLMLLNPSGGLVGGDHLQADLVLNSGSRVCLTTPSATKVYRTLGPPAVQRTTIHVGADAVVEYIPDPVIPYPSSAFHQSLQIDLAERSQALVYDAFALGRVARGERWAFKEFVNRITVTLHGRPIFIDRFKLVPPVGNLGGNGGMEDFGYSAMFGLFAEDFPTWRELCRSHARLVGS